MRRLAMVALAMVWLASPARSDTGLVMKDGSVVKCEGYELKGNVYILKSKDGKKVSLKADKVDPVATAEFAKKAEAMAAAQAALEASGGTSAATPADGSAPKGEGVKTLTDADLQKYKGQSSSMGDQSSVSAETPDMPSRDDYEKLEKGSAPPPDKGAAPKEDGASKDEAPKETPPASKETPPAESGDSGSGA